MPRNKYNPYENISHETIIGRINVAIKTTEVVQLEQKIASSYSQFTIDS